MPTTPSPAFSINGAAVGAKVAVAAGGAIVATLDDIAGVAPVTWAVSRTDETTDDSDYTLTPSGSVNQTVSFTAGEAGTAGVLKATVAGGIDPSTSRPSAAMSAEVKWYVPTVSGREVLCAGELDDEDNVSDATFGGVAAINPSIRGSWGELVASGSGALAGGAGKTTLATIAMADDEVSVYALRLLAFDATTPHGAWYNVILGFKCISGTASAIGSSGGQDGEDDEAWARTLEASGGNVLATFTPDSANETSYVFHVYKLMTHNFG